MIHSTQIESPAGLLTLVERGGALAAIRFGAGDACDAPTALLTEATGQLEAYFAGDLTAFDLPLAPAGTRFQLAVWRALAAIPYGATTSYGALAASLGRPDTVRAVGAANGANPLPIVLPCHRVIGASGALTGYGGGLAIKRLLLDLEAGVLSLI